MTMRSSKLRYDIGFNGRMSSETMAGCRKNMHSSAFDKIRKRTRRRQYSEY